MRVLVCGSRNWKDGAAIERELVAAGASLLIHGYCRGADMLAEASAKRLGIPWKGYAAAWRAHGRAAGPRRNRFMLEDGKPDLVLAFRLDGSSRGTDDMIARARVAGVPVRIIRGEP